ncbi:ATP-grasp domain-containing protein [Neptunomonas qingdaonensis]|uniref:ATP-grasp domain-containing protein n=1 Tax=Neptunomonas qingdaonensis TaxID=1045558 RepID=A0A1I2UTE5_9GAMM|nr:ATP-grasp domain-containing protein [Neptunomonas qingdaonensis]SFG80372.1 ATP-grasp domain-containing protein [Neptunomonas qingdaonensis]
MKNIFVFGADEFNLSLIRSLESAQDYCFHELYQYHEVKTGKEFPVRTLYEGAVARLRKYPGSVDAIVGYLDFPVSTMLPLLCHPFGLPSPSFDAVLKCEHKYWSRLEQRRVIPEYIPDFCAVNPFKDDYQQQITLDYPFWLKPVKAVLSHLGFMVRNDSELDMAIAEIRKKIYCFAKPFNYLLQFTDLPDNVAAIDGYHCIAEAIISRGQQCTLEGYVFDGNLCVYGAIDSIREGQHGSSFSRYQYPSSIPQPVQDKMVAVTERFLTSIGFDNGPFNIEYYWEKESHHIRLLEINTRISKSHSPLFRNVDGMPNHLVMLALALGKQPVFPHRQGLYRYSAKFMWRTHADAKVTRVPTEQEVQAVTRRIAGTEIQLHVHEGMRLSELNYQDSYSYEIATVFIGGDSEQELLHKYQDVQQALPLELVPLP